jgi:hypothetical protein
VTLSRQGVPWIPLLPPGIWALAAAFLVSHAVRRSGAEALRLLRVAAAGFLTLVALAAPPVLARVDSGRDLFAPARGEEVLAWNAWRTAWMAGYFYNDGRVRELGGLAELGTAVAERPRLVLCGPAERRRLQGAPAFSVELLAEGPRGHALLRVRAR